MEIPDSEGIPCQTHVGMMQERHAPQLAMKKRRDVGQLDRMESSAGWL